MLLGGKNKALKNSFSLRGLKIEFHETIDNFTDALLVFHGNVDKFDTRIEEGWFFLIAVASLDGPDNFTFAFDMNGRIEQINFQFNRSKKLNAALKNNTYAADTDIFCVG